jgi:hypothetical protein
MDWPKYITKKAFEMVVFFDSHLKPIDKKKTFKKVIFSRKAFMNN